MLRVYNLILFYQGPSSTVDCILYFLCIRCLPQQYHPRPRMLNSCKPKVPRPSSSVWPGGRSIRALPSLAGWQTRPASSARKDQGYQGAVWRLHGIWWKPSVQRYRPESGAMLQPSVWAQTALLPLLMGHTPCIFEWTPLGLTLYVESSL